MQFIEILYDVLEGKSHDLVIAFVALFHGEPFPGARVPEVMGGFILLHRQALVEDGEDLGHEQIDLLDLLVELLEVSVRELADVLLKLYHLALHREDLVLDDVDYLLDDCVLVPWVTGGHLHDVLIHDVEELGFSVLTLFGACVGVQQTDGVQAVLDIIDIEGFHIHLQILHLGIQHNLELLHGFSLPLHQVPLPVLMNNGGNLL